MRFFVVMRMPMIAINFGVTVPCLILLTNFENEGLAIMDKRKAFAFLENVSYFRFQHIKNK